MLPKDLCRSLILLKQWHRFLEQAGFPNNGDIMSQRQLLAKRIGLVALTNLLVELNSLIMLPLLTKNLPASEYGVWVQISVTIGLSSGHSPSWTALLHGEVPAVRQRKRKYSRDILFDGSNNRSGRSGCISRDFSPGRADCISSFRWPPEYRASISPYWSFWSA